MWPHDNGLIAEGFRRYGFVKEAAEIAHNITTAASHFLLYQVPELYSGIARTPGAFPVQYPGATVQQAWAAGSAFMLLQVLLGIQPDAPRGRLYIDPWLPEWLPDVTLYDLRVGKQKLDLRFWNEDEETHFEILRGDPTTVEKRSMCSLRRLLRGDRPA